MKVARSASRLARPGRKACLAIGFFDGVHIGHQQIIRQAQGDARQQDALSVVVTFDRHPASVVAPGQAPALIQPRPQRLHTIAALGPDALLLLEFTPSLRRQPAETFIRRLHNDLGGIHSICIGADFHFGYQRSGNVALLERLGGELDFRTHGIRAISLGDETVSSTRVRQAIRDGLLEQAGQMLGRSYSIASRVMRGDRVGHQLGYPTANLDVEGLVLPPDGVYAAQGLLDGALHRAVLNIGSRPTITPAASRKRLEVHLLDYAGDLYDRELEVVFVQHLRGEQRFPSREALQEQIKRDIARTHALFSR